MRLPPDQCERIFAGEVPLKVWREFRGLEQSELREQSGIRVDIIDRIERGVRKANRPEALKLARALDVAIHNIYPHHRAYSGCSAIDVNEDEILSRELEKQSVSVVYKPRLRPLSVKSSWYGCMRPAVWLQAETIQGVAAG